MIDEQSCTISSLMYCRAMAMNPKILIKISFTVSYFKMHRDRGNQKVKLFKWYQTKISGNVGMYIELK